MYSLFNFGHKKLEGFMVSPMNGKMVSVREIPDEVFSEKILGDGAAVIPEDDTVVSPVDGEIVQIADTGHAFCIRSDDGLDVLLHIGVDTVNMKGEGFESLVSVGQKVKKGEKIATADVKLIEEKGYPLHSAVLITNMQEIENMDTYTGEARAGETKLISYIKK